MISTTTSPDGRYVTTVDSITSGHASGTVITDIVAQSEDANGSYAWNETAVSGGVTLAYSAVHVIDANGMDTITYQLPALNGGAAAVTGTVTISLEEEQFDFGNVENIYQTILGRLPTEAELQASLQYYSSSTGFNFVGLATALLRTPFKTYDSKFVDISMSMRER